jgi:hypothetical protein
MVALIGHPDRGYHRLVLRSRKAVANHKRKEPMLTQVGEGVLVHQSELLQNNAVVAQGRAGVLLIDPGIQGSEMACLANDLRAARCGRLLDASSLGSRALARRAR